MGKALEQFRKEESELFDSETGEFYRGILISPLQCELMRDSINELQDKHTAFQDSHKRLIVALESMIEALKEKGLIKSLPTIEDELKKAKEL